MTKKRKINIEKEIKGKLPQEVIKVVDHTKYTKKIHPEKLGINLQTGNCDVATDFFYQVWGEQGSDSSWNGWICQDSNKNITGVIVLQAFVHESNFFQWGTPLSHISKKPLTNGEIKNLAEISVFCAKGSGSLLLHALEKWVAEHHQFDAIVVSSTVGALGWYKNKGYKEVKAYRLEPNHSNRRLKSHAHRYRHRINDLSIDLELDPPSLMLYKETSRIRQDLAQEKLLSNEEEASLTDSDLELHSSPIQSFNFSPLHISEGKSELDDHSAEFPVKRRKAR